MTPPAALNRWLIANSDPLPKTLAMDGKDLGGKGTLGTIITLCHHPTGAPLAMTSYSDAKDDCELPIDQALLEQAADVLPNTVVTTDALHSQKKASILTASGSRHFHALKDNQPTIYQISREKLAGRAADWISETECQHGRIEWRVCGFDLDAALFSAARQLASLTRFYREEKSASGFKSEPRYFITSLRENEASHARLAEIARGHWAIENKNHLCKDATLWREDRGCGAKPREPGISRYCATRSSRSSSPKCATLSIRPSSITHPTAPKQSSSSPRPPLIAHNQPIALRAGRLHQGEELFEVGGVEGDAHLAWVGGCGSCRCRACGRGR